MKSLVISLACAAGVAMATDGPYVCGEDACDQFPCVVNTRAAPAGAILCSRGGTHEYCLSSGHDALNSIYGTCGGYLEFDPEVMGCNWPGKVNFDACLYGDEALLDNDITSSEATTLEVTETSASTAEVTMPEATTAEVTSSEVTTPELTTPEVTTPEVTTPEVTTGTTGNTGTTLAPLACDANPCHIDSTCNNDDTAELGFTCTCMADITGQYCELPIPCASSPCLNGATCKNIENYASYECDCGTDYSGDHCELFIPCQSYPCQNGGTCENGPNYEGYSCSCGVEFEGDTCELLIVSDPCEDNPCKQSGGGCAPTADLMSYTCRCELNWTGPNCDIYLFCDNISCGDPDETTCYNIGMGHNFNDVYDLGGFIADCDTADASSRDARCDFIDTDSQYIYPANPNDEDPHPQVYSMTDAICHCAPGRVGWNCEDVDPCFVNPCSNGGVCTRVAECDYHPCTPQPACECADGWTGDTCDTAPPANPCDSNPCNNNGGRCEASVDLLTYTCGCPDGFTGIQCNIFLWCNEVDCGDPSLSTCYNIGWAPTNSGSADWSHPWTSVYDLGAFIIECETADVNSRDERCDYIDVDAEYIHPVDPLADSDGNLYNPNYSLSEGICSCPPGKLGWRCEVDDPCVGHVCDNGGTCSPTGTYNIFRDIVDIQPLCE